MLFSSAPNPLLTPPPPVLLCLQHTASTVAAATHPAPRLPTVHRRGRRQLHQPQRKPRLQPAAQTHAPLLPGNGLRPVSFTHPPRLALCNGDKRFFFLFVCFLKSTMDRLMSSAYVRILSQHKEDGWVSGGDGGCVFTLRTSLTPGLCRDLEPPRSGRRRWEDALDDPFFKNETKQTNSHDSQQRPLVHVLLWAFGRTHRLTVKRTRASIETHTHRRTRRQRDGGTAVDQP